MAEYSRGSVLEGEVIDLRVVFLDSAGNLVDPDFSNIGASSVLPVLYIYEGSTDSEVMAEEMEAEIYTSAIAGPLSSSRLSLGYFRYQYTVPTSYDAGIWHDVWVATINGVTYQEALTFTVQDYVDLDPQSISQNTMIVIELSDDIADEDGNHLEDTSLFYTTTYNPMYASPDMLRAEIGPWIDYIPNDTLALMIHWSSKEAEFIQGPIQESWGNIRLARTKFVIYDAALRSIQQPGGGNVAGFTSGGRKQLGDLMIQKGEVVTAASADTISWLSEQRNAWWRVVNAGGNIVPGQGFAPTFAVKGIYDPDRPQIGRRWEDPRDFHFAIPTVNRKVTRAGRLRGRWNYVQPHRRGSSGTSTDVLND